MYTPPLSYISMASIHESGPVRLSLLKAVAGSKWESCTREIFLIQAAAASELPPWVLLVPVEGHSARGLLLQAGSYTNYFADALIAEAELDSRVVGIHAAMGGGTGMNRFEQRFPERTFDVGIAEQVRARAPRPGPPQAQAASARPALRTRHPLLCYRPNACFTYRL